MHIQEGTGSGVLAAKTERAVRARFFAPQENFQEVGLNGNFPTFRASGSPREKFLRILFLRIKQL